MSQLSHDPADDPRLTAYVLNELDPPERAEVEAWLAAHPDGQRFVADLQKLTADLSLELQGEPALALDPARRATVAQCVERGSPPVRKSRRHLAWIALLTTGGVAATLTAALNLPRFLRQHGEPPEAAVAMDDSFGLIADNSSSTTPRGSQIREQFESMSYGRGAVTQSDPTKDGTWYRNEYKDELAAPTSMDPSSISGGGGPAYTPLPTAASIAEPVAAPVTGPSNSTSFAKGTPLAPRGGSLEQLKSWEFESAEGIPVVRYTVPTSDLTVVTGGSATSVRTRREAEARGSSPGGESKEASPESLNLFESLASAETYQAIIENAFLPVAQHPLSTFGVDVDTAAYANVRRYLNGNQMPPADAVRIEEMVNYFSYSYAAPTDQRPFAAHIEIANCPWQPAHRLVRVGLKGKEIPRAARPPSHLVFLIDTSGSMEDANKLPLLQIGLQMLAEEMREDDQVSIVTYSDTAQLVVDALRGNHRQTLVDTIRSLKAAGSTNGAGGIQLAYETAARHLKKDGVNRVILCTDGDFNVGISDEGQLVQLIQEKAKSGVFLSVFGFGMGNLKDSKLELLADRGNGQYGYIDAPREAQKAFIEDLNGTLLTIAKDVKLQVEFNPALIAETRLIGYENRRLATADFNDDQKDAGEIGSGHTVTALYEIIPVGAAAAAPVNPGLKYQPKPAPAAAPVAAENAKEWLTLSIRYKLPDAAESTRFEVPLAAADGDGTKAVSPDFQWAASVAAFGMLLRNSPHKGQASFDLVRELATAAKGADPSGHRQEFLDLVQKAQTLQNPAAPGTSAPATEAPR